MSLACVNLETLRDYFEKFGDVQEVSLMVDNMNRSRYEVNFTLINLYFYLSTSSLV